jgi:hypothetical protein
MSLSELKNWPVVAEYRFASALSNSPVIAFGAYEMLQIQFNVEGYSGSGIAAFRFNGDTTAGNYASEFITWSTAAPTVTNFLGTFAGFKLGANAVTVARSGFLTIKNFTSASRLITCQSLTHQGAGTVADVQSVGGGKYVGASQITSIQMLVDPVGSITMPAGTGFVVSGYTPGS